MCVHNTDLALFARGSNGHILHYPTNSTRFTCTTGRTGRTNLCTPALVWSARARRKRGSASTVSSWMDRTILRLRSAATHQEKGGRGYSKPPSGRQSRFASVGLWCLCACRVFVRVFCVGVVCLWRVVLCVCMRCVEQLWRRDGRRPTRASATHGQLEMDVYSIRRVGDSKCILITVGHRWRGTRGVWNMEGARAGVGLGKSRGPNHLSSQPASNKY